MTLPFAEYKRGEKTGEITAEPIADYLAKYLSKEVRAACLMGKHLWAGFGNATWCSVKDIYVRSWLRGQYRRLRRDALELGREQRYGIFQEVPRNYARCRGLVA